MKVCTRCNQELPETEFYKQIKRRGGKITWVGLQPKCKNCDKETRQAYRESHREQERETERKRYWSDLDLSRQRNRIKYHNNRESVRESYRKWKEKNPFYNRYACSKRKAMRIQATPKWANDGYIRIWYEFAQMEQDRLGRKVHVDHIVPLDGETVCGLHCEDNMQLLFAEDNIRKSNHHA